MEACGIALGNQERLGCFADARNDAGGVLRGLDPIKSGHDSFPCFRITALALSMTRLRIPATLEIAPGLCRND
jgi:hypothetical protein